MPKLRAKVVGPVKQHFVSLSQTLTNMLRHSDAQRFFDLAALKFFAQRFY